MSRELLTMVVAAWNEAEALPKLHPRIAAVLDALLREEGVHGRVLYVDDGSSHGPAQRRAGDAMGLHVAPRRVDGRRLRADDTQRLRPVLL